MASRNGKKTSGLRMLWIPGGRKSHPKGRFDSTNKHVPYTTRQKKSEVWSLGGRKAQNDLLLAEPDVSLLDGPSTSGVATIACATATGTAVAAASAVPNNSSSSPSSPASSSPSIKCLTDPARQSNDASIETVENRHATPSTPDSTTSTAQLFSAPQSPLIAGGGGLDLDPIDSDSENPSNTNTMPAKAHQLPPAVPASVTTTTTAQIIEDNRFSILGKDITTNEFDIYTLPSPPRDKDEEHLNSSSGTTASQKSSTGSPHKEHETSSNTESHRQNQHNQNNGSLNNSPTKKGHQHRNHNNNQGDVNSIESITEDTASAKIPSGDLDWLDSALQSRNDREILGKPKKKKKKKIASAKELDQLDGVPMKESISGDTFKEEDEKVVKCLYYTLMCCDCTIS